MRIFPINNKQHTWRNYSNYLNWLSRDVVSLRDYLNTFNPDFHILNQDLNACTSKNWSDHTITSSKETNEVFYEVQLEDDSAYVCFPGVLNYREGIFAPQINHYACLDYSYKNNLDNLLDNWNNCLADGVLVPLEPNQVIILTKKIQGLDVNTAELKEKLSSYLILSQPSAGLYKIQNIMNGVSFNFVENGQAALGGNISFVIELTPTRYFISDVNKNGFWGQYAQEWNIQGGYWANTNADLSLIVQNKLGSVWTNSYPLAHKTYLKTDDRFDEFVFDHTFSTSEISISSHNTSLYKLTALLEKKELESEIWKQIYVSIT